MSNDPLLDEILGQIPRELRGVPGSVLYSGRDAFVGASALYLLGNHPGGDPAVETKIVAAQTKSVLRHEPTNWSAYRDASWGPGAPPGAWKMQPRVLHLLKNLDLDPGLVPASNIVFARSRSEADIPPQQLRAWADACWPFHQGMIGRLGVKVIVCFGATAATFVRGKVGAARECDRFVETNGREWTSRTFTGAGGITVVQTSHPSRADWRNPRADVTPLVARAS